MVGSLTRAGGWSVGFGVWPAVLSIARRPFGAWDPVEPLGETAGGTRSIAPWAHRAICDKHRRGDDAPGGMLLADDLVCAGHVHPLDAPDAALGYLMVEPRRHVRGLGDLTEDEAGRIGVITSKLDRLLRDVAGVQPVYSFVFGDRVEHLHVHLAPRYPAAPVGLRGLGAGRHPPVEGRPTRRSGRHR